MEKIREFQEKIKKVYNKDKQENIYFLFIIFSRFEYTLKRNDYVKKNGHADWETYSKDISKEFDTKTNVVVKEVTSYVKKYPLQIQKYDTASQSLTWISAKYNDTKTLAENLTSFVKQVRNNLFHGAKYYGNPIEEPTRDERLIKYCIIILSECLNVSDAKFCEIFLGEIDE